MPPSFPSSTGWCEAACAPCFLHQCCRICRPPPPRIFLTSVAAGVRGAQSGRGHARREHARFVFRGPHGRHLLLHAVEVREKDLAEASRVDRARAHRHVTPHSRVSQQFFDRDRRAVITSPRTPSRIVAHRNAASSKHQSRSSLEVAEANRGFLTDQAVHANACKLVGFRRFIIFFSVSIKPLCIRLLLQLQAPCARSRTCRFVVAFSECSL